jgi:hypothetical protein
MIYPFSVSLFMTFRSAGKKALQGQNKVKLILARGVKRAIFMRVKDFPTNIIAACIPMF